MNQEQIKEYNNISLKEYVDIRLLSLEKATTIVANNLEKATAIAASGLEKRLEGMNEFRNQLKDQTATFITRTEHDSIIKRLNDDIRILREARALLEGKASQLSTNIATGIAIIGLIISLLGFMDKSNSSDYNSNSNPNSMSTISIPATVK